MFEGTSSSPSHSLTTLGLNMPGQINAASVFPSDCSGSSTTVRVRSDDDVIPRWTDLNGVADKEMTPEGGRRWGHSWLDTGGKIYPIFLNKDRSTTLQCAFSPKSITSHA
jgi:hypothetical protein